MTASLPVALVTGASRGLGAAVAQQLRPDFDLLLVARDEGALADVERDLPAGPGRVWRLLADFADVDAPAQLVETSRQLVPQVDVIIHAAAEQGPIGALDQCAWEAWERTLRVNLLAPVALTRACLPLMRDLPRRGKLIFVSGGGATGPRPRFSAYATAKCGLARLAETLAAELRDTGIDVNSVAPGSMPSAMTREIMSAGPLVAGTHEVEQARRLLENAASPVSRAAALIGWLASSESDGVTGRLLSAVWDPWETLADHTTDLDASDIYTLRRIVPKDRGRSWGDR